MSNTFILVIIEDIDLLFPKKDTSIQEPGLLPALQRIISSFQDVSHAGRAILVLVQCHIGS